MAHKRISSMYFMVDSKDDLTYLPESQMGTTCFVIEDACEYKCTSDGRWIQQIASSAATTPGAGENVDLTGYATEGYVDTKIANLVGSAPENLNTLHEIAVAFKENGDVLDTLNEAIGEKANRSEIPDVSIFQEKGDYALRSEIPDVSNFQEKGDYALQSEIPDLTNYALKEELPEVPSLEGYALKSELPDLTNYARKEEIPEIPSLDAYALKSEIPSVAGLATEEYVTDAIANVEHPLPSTASPNQHLVTNEKGEMIWEERSHWTEEQEDYLVNTSGSGKYIPCPGLHSLKPNKEYTIIHNDAEYKCISQEMNGTVVLGNLKFAGSSYEDTGEPFFFPGIDKGLVTFYAMFSEGGEHTFSVFGPVDIAKPLSEFYMPQSVPVVKSASKGQAVIVEEVQNGHPTCWTVATIPTKISELDNDVKHATEEYVDIKVAELVDNAPETLNTLKEVADALNENASTAEALNQAIGNKVDKTDYPESTNPNQYLTTDAEGNKIWENKLAYSSLETIPFIEEMTWTGAQTSFPMAIANAQAGDKITIFIDDIPYYGILEDDSSTIWLVKFDEEYEQPWIQRGKFYISKLGYNMSLGGVPLSWAVGKMSAIVTTNIVHPIDNKYLGLNITQGTGDLSMSVNGEAENASGYRALSLNGGLASGNLSIAIGSTAVASGTYALAAGNGNAQANYSVAFGEQTNAVTDNSMTIGTHNVTDENKEYLFIVGNGSKGEFNPQTGYQRTYSNAHTVNQDGTGWFQKEIKIGGASEHDENAKKLATEEYVEEKLLDPDLVRATAFNELVDTVKGLDKYCAFVKQGDQIKLGNVQEYSKMQEEMLNGANKFHATLAITFTNEEGLLISETCYAKNVMSAIDMNDGSSPYTNFSFETFDGETIKFRWNADNTISNITIISAEETIE